MWPNGTAKVFYTSFIGKSLVFEINVLQPHLLSMGSRGLKCPRSNVVLYSFSVKKLSWRGPCVLLALYSFILFSCTFFLEIISFTFNREFHFLIFLPLHSNSDHFSGKLFWWISKRHPKPSLRSRPKNLEDVCVSNHRQILNPSAASQTWPVHKNWDRNLISIFRWSNYRKKTTTVLRT